MGVSEMGDDKTEKSIKAVAAFLNEISKCEEGDRDHKLEDDLERVLQAAQRQGGEAVAEVIPNNVGVEIAWLHPRAALPPGSKLYAAPQTVAPEGWTLVPVEPTRSMRYAVEDTELPEFCESSRQSRHHDLGAQAYRAMLAAAPQPPVSQTAESDTQRDLSGAGDAQADGVQLLAEFGRRCFDDAVAEGADIEWDKAFEDAQEVGLLEPEHRNEPCAEIEQCRCSEAGIDFPTTCYRVPDRLMPLLQKEQRTQAQPQEVD